MQAMCHLSRGIIAQSLSVETTAGIKQQLGVSENRGTLLRGPYTKDPTI